MHKNLNSEGFGKVYRLISLVNTTDVNITPHLILAPFIYSINKHLVASIEE